MTNWQDISSAPKDGTWMHLTDGHHAYVGAWAPQVHGNSHPWVFVEELGQHQPEGCCDRENDSRIECNAFVESAPVQWAPLLEVPK